MQKLNLTKRPGKIGKSVNTRTEMHGKDEVPGQDIPIAGIVLNAEELCAVTDEETAAVGFFKMDGDQYVPRILALNPGTLGHKFSNATIKLSGGGMTLMSCTLQVNPENGDPSAQMLINAKVSITLKAELEEEEADDPELPLDHQESAGDGVPLEGLVPESPDEDQPMSRTGRRIQSSAKKRSRKDTH
jgi:hypothetical protein